MTEEKRRQLEYAHEYFRDESRGFWTKVAALLTVNSILVAAFTILYCHFTDATPLLLAIAASGIVIQTMWPLFIAQSYCIWEALGELIGRIEAELVGDNNELKISIAMEKAYEKLAKPLKCCTCLYEVFRKNPAGAIAIILFFSVFISIWIIAVLIIDTCWIYKLPAILIPSIIVLISMCISRRTIFKKRLNTHK